MPFNSSTSNSTPPISLSMVNAVNGVAPTTSSPKGDPPPTTTVNISVENNTTTFAPAFVFTWDVQGSSVYSPYVNCNDPLYYADAVEVFIAPGGASETPTEYLEVELNINQELFLYV